MSGFWLAAKTTERFGAENLQNLHEEMNWDFRPRYSLNFQELMRNEPAPNKSWVCANGRPNNVTEGCSSSKKAKWKNWAEHSKYMGSEYRRPASWVIITGLTGQRMTDFQKIITILIKILNLILLLLVFWFHLNTIFKPILDL